MCIFICTCVCCLGILVLHTFHSGGGVRGEFVELFVSAEHIYVQSIGHDVSEHIIYFVCKTISLMSWRVVERMFWRVYAAREMWLFFPRTCMFIRFSVQCTKHIGMPKSTDRYILCYTLHCTVLYVCTRVAVSRLRCFLLLFVCRCVRSLVLWLRLFVRPAVQDTSRYATASKMYLANSRQYTDLCLNERQSETEAADWLWFWLQHSVYTVTLRPIQ